MNLGGGGLIVIFLIKIVIAIKYRKKKSFRLDVFVCRTAQFGQKLCDYI